MALTRPKYSQIYDTDYKQSVRVATTADVGNLLVTGNMTNSVDGVSLTVNDRILVKDQLDTKQNGIYRVSVVGTGADGTWIRALDADASDKVTSGLTTVVALGSNNASKTFRLTTSDPITLGVSLLTFINPYDAAAAAGANTQIQFNSLGMLGASANLTFNTSSNTLTITGNVTANNVTGTILTASQPNITTLAGVTSIGASGTTTLTGILQTAAQTNVTSLGTLTSLAVTGAVTTSNIASDNHNYANGTSIITTISTTISTANINMKGYVDAGLSSLSSNKISAEASNVTVTTSFVNVAIASTNVASFSASGIGGTLTTAAQTNITSVGTLSGLTVTAAIAGSVSGSAATVTGAAQGNITSVGTLTSLATGAITTTGTLALNADGGLTTNQTTFLLANATATTLNIGGAATTVSLGAATGTLNLNNATTAIAGVSTHAGVLYANATTASTTYTDGGLVVAGGVGIAGNVHIQSGKILHIGPDLVGEYSNVLVQFSSDVNSYSQVLLQNISNGLSASSDYICVADTGTDSINYIDYGINSSNYSDVNYTIGTGLDGYSYTNGGNFAIGTQTSGKNIIFHTGGTLSANLRAKITDVGLTVNTTTATSSITTGALVINGGCGIAGDLRLGGNLYVTNIISSSSQTISVNDPMLYLTADTPFPYNYDIGFYSAFTGGPANVYAHTGFVRNDADGAWNLFSNIAEPAAGQISLTNAIYDAINTGALTIKGDPVTSIINGGTSGVGNIGTAAGIFNTVYASKLQGVIQTASHPLITTLDGVTSIGASGATTITGILQTAAQTNITSVGTLSGLTVSATITGSVSGSAATVTGAAQTAITSVGTLAGVTVSSTIAANANNTINIGALGTVFATVYATTFSGVSTTAKYADLAENYQADAVYAPGTVVHFGGEFEVTACDTDMCSRVAGVVSTNPAHLMNTDLVGDNVVALALTGRVPCLVQGTVRKGDMMVSAGNGRARAEINPKIGTVIGKALVNSEGDATIEVVVGRV